MIKFIFYFLLVIANIGMFLIIILRYLAIRLSVKLKNEPRYMISRTTYIPKKLILKENTIKNKVYNKNVRLLNNMIDYIIILLIICPFVILTLILYTNYILPLTDRPSWFKI